MGKTVGGSERTKMQPINQISRRGARKELKKGIGTLFSKRLAELRMQDRTVTWKSK